MLSRKNIMVAALVAGGIAALAACGTSTKTAAPASASVTQTATPAAPAGQAAPNDTATPPTVAKTQGQVQILNGPATAPVPPVTNPMQGSNVIQLNATSNG